MGVCVNQLSVAAPIVQVPHTDTLVVARTQEPSPPRVEDQVVHPVVVPYKCYKTTPALGFPKLDGLVPAAARQILTCQLRGTTDLRLFFTGATIFYLLGLFFFLFVMLRLFRLNFILHILNSFCGGHLREWLIWDRRILLLLCVSLCYLLLSLLCCHCLGLALHERKHI